MIDRLTNQRERKLNSMTLNFIEGLRLTKMRLAALVIDCLAYGSGAQAASLWISDASGNIGLVNLVTGDVTNFHNTQLILTDIAFVGTNMYGTTFSGLYSINTASGNASPIGSYTPNTSLAALVGSGSGLLGASSTTKTIYNISPSSAAASPYATSPLVTAGDLAFAGGALYESGTNVDGTNELINVTSGQPVANFSLSGVAQGGIFGLADDGTTLYATQGTQIFTVDPATGALSFDINYSGRNLGNAVGAAFVSEGVSTVPLPPALPMFTFGLVALGVVGFAQRNRTRLLAV